MFLEVNARKAYAYTGGKPFVNDAACVVFIHGAQNDHSVWAMQSRYLAHHGYSVLALDLPGHGLSEGDALSTVEALADWVLAVLAAKQVKHACLIGHSMGSLIALEAAARAPHLVTGLGLLGTAYPMKVSDSLLIACKENEAAAFDMINRFSHSSLVHHPGSPGPGFSVYWQGRRLMERQKPGVLLTDFEACNNYSHGSEAAALVRCPTLLLSAENDLMTPPKAAQGLKEQLAQRIFEKFSHQIVRHCGHALMTEQPDETLLALKSFLNTIHLPS